MNEYSTFSNQTWLDISIYLYGTPDYAFEIAVLNGLSITDDIPAGTIVKVPADKEKNRLVLLSLQSNNSIPATALTEKISENLRQRGIGFMRVGRTFKVGKNE